MAEVFHPPPWMTIGGDYSTDKISAQLITKDTKRPASSSLTPSCYQKEKLLVKVLIPVLLVCHFTETKKRLCYKKIITSKSAMNLMDFQNYPKYCVTFHTVSHWLNPVFYYLNPALLEFNQSPLKPAKRFSLTKGPIDSQHAVFLSSFEQHLKG